MGENALERLRVELEGLRASRARVLAASDASRRAIERDLHDGLQQQLVALVVNLQHARQLVDDDPAAARALLEEISGDVRQALDQLRLLAERIYPARLDAGGLAVALRAAAARAGISAQVKAVDDYSPAVAATVYFCCLEALQNAATHAGAGARATVTVRKDQDMVAFEVVDDGKGFAQDAAQPGVGLALMRDRVETLGGRLEIDSGPGRGTRVSGTLPAAADDQDSSGRPPSAR